MRKFLFGFVVLLFVVIHAPAADHPNSLVLKSHTVERSPFRLQMNRSDDEIWDAFQCIAKANSGDPIAQHELGLRYLFGRGFSPDTQKAAVWIGKAARQQLGTAQYNYGLLLNNGWGIAWDPFEAFRQIRAAARRGLMEAEYVYGLFLCDNLVVPHDYRKAYGWIRMAADSGFVPAKETLDEFDRRGMLTELQKRAAHPDDGNTDSVHAAVPINPALQPVMMDFSRDSVTPPADTLLLREAVHGVAGSPDTLADAGHFSTRTAAGGVDTLKHLRESAAAGSPEALTALGRLTECGNGIRKDPVLASAYYLRAIRFDSPWAPLLLWNLIHGDEGYYAMLEQRVKAGDPAAAFVWAGLIDLGFDSRLTSNQAFALLHAAATSGIPEAVVQEGLCYYSGHWVAQDRSRGRALLADARQRGSREAAVRLWAMDLETGSGRRELIDSLRSAGAEGSVLAEAVLGYCYQAGRGVPVDTAQAVKWYREAARRGSKVAFSALRGMYDAIRPSGTEFMIPD